MIEKREKWARVRMRMVALLFTVLFVLTAGRAFHL